MGERRKRAETRRKRRAARSSATRDSGSESSCWGEIWGNWETFVVDVVESIRWEVFRDRRLFDGEAAVAAVVDAAGDVEFLRRLPLFLPLPLPRPDGMENERAAGPWDGGMRRKAEL